MQAGVPALLEALISAPSAFSTGDKLIIVAWIAQTFLQLVLLPIIIVGQNVQAESAEQRAQATYDDASAVLEEAKRIQAHMYAQDAQIQQILAKLPEPASRTTAGSGRGDSGRLSVPGVASASQSTVTSCSVKLAGST